MSAVVISCIPLVVWTVVLLLPETKGCMKTAWSSGYLTTAVANFTFDSSGASSCRCCGLCHQIKTCASLSYNADTRECQLYSSVASYENFTLDDKSQYFVMPGRSQHHQFCRQDSDCQAEGDFCRGRVCTELTAVTCRVIFETFGAGERYGDDRMFGWLNDTAVALSCMMGKGFHGYTRLLRNMNELRELNRTTFMEYNTALDPEVYPHSILSLAEYIRLAGDNDTSYSIKVFRMNQGFMIDFKLPREEPVLSDTPRPGLGNATVSGYASCSNLKLSPPYLPATGPTLITINAEEAGAVEGAIAREDGQISWKKPCDICILLIYIRE